MKPAHVDQTNTLPERVQKTPGNEHVLQMALDALEDVWDLLNQFEAPSDSCIGASMIRTNTAAEALRAALAAPQGEHDALRCAVGNCMFNGEVKSHTPNCQHSAPQGEPVKGDVLPPVGSRVYIRHGRDDDAHACTVTGYYAWGDLNGAKHLHRVFVRLVYEGTDPKQARMLCDCWSTEDAALLDFNPAPHPAAPVPPTVCPEHDEWVAQGMKPCDNPAQCWEHCGQLGKSLEHASVSQRQTCFDCAKAMIYPRPDDCWQCGKGLINAYVKEQQPGPLTATQFFTQTTNGVSGPVKSPVRFMDRPEQPDEFKILAITTAYESGVGKGHQAYKRGEEISNPYNDGYRCDLAWEMGYDEGKKQAARAQPAEREPYAYAYAVLFPHQHREDLVHDLEELCDDMTNHDHEITPLYTHPKPKREPLSVEAYTALAHRIASKYRHNGNPLHIEYTFLPHTLGDFVRALEAAITKGTP